MRMAHSLDLAEIQLLLLAHGFGKTRAKSIGWLLRSEPMKKENWADFLNRYAISNWQLAMSNPSSSTHGI